MKQFFFLIFLITSIAPGRAYNYGEHKHIGDQAFINFMNQLIASQTLGSPQQTLHWWKDNSGVAMDSLTRVYTFTQLFTTESPISYGVFNGLSGDHASNPLFMEEQLRYAQSSLQQTLLAHNQALAQHLTSAADKKLAQIDNAYLSLALNNFSHFYYYGHSFSQHVNVFSAQLIRKGLVPNQVTDVFSRLSRTNAINTYVTVHAMALELAHRAGSLYHTDPQRAKQYFFYSLLYNGFADHFLEDSFAAGHLVVNRTLWASFTNNRSLHNLYNRNGVEVTNLKGQIWHAYGDGFFNQGHSVWAYSSDLSAITHEPYTPESKRIIEAVSVSIQEVWVAFQQAQNGHHESLVDQIPVEIHRIFPFFLQHFAALMLIPVPFNTRIEQYLPSAPNLINLQERSGLLPYRNFDKSRIGNSLALGFGNSVVNQSIRYSETEIRLTTSPFRYGYRYRPSNRSQLLNSYFIRPVLSAAFGRRMETDLQIKNQTTVFKGGINTNFDFWVNSKRYIGLYAYLEGGAYRETGERYRPLFAPAVGMQLGPLLGIRYYNQPAWARLVTQLLLPLKFRVSAYFVRGHQPIYYYSTELDLFY